MLKPLHRILAVLIFQFAFIGLYGQGEGNNWYFGKWAGITFATQPPSGVTGGQINTTEGVASISDNAGNLLFYTDGIKVYSRDHTMMPNGSGLWGDPSSTQSGVIVQMPGQPSKYYVFTVAAQAGYYNPLFAGAAYSIVDMNANNGKGDVIIKNKPLVTPTSEKLTAVRHCNGKDFWIITHKWNSSTFCAFLVTSTGVNPTSVNTNIGSLHREVLKNGKNEETIGYLKASPDGKKIASAINYVPNQPVELFDFNNSTGEISNYNTIPGDGFAYGVSFSPDASKLYVTYAKGSATVVQYDLSITHRDIGSTAVVLVKDQTSLKYGALQLGPDGKMYVSKHDGYLDVIQNPNKKGVACNYTINAIPLNGPLATYGLPNFLDNFFIDKNVDLGPDKAICNKPVLLDAKAGWKNYLWSNGATTPSITVVTPGKYWVSVNDGACLSDDDTVMVNSFKAAVNLGSDTTLCTNQSLILNPGQDFSSYLWQDGSNSNTYTVRQPGTYWVRATANNCITSDTITVNLQFNPYVNLGSDTIICTDELFELNATVSGGMYKWQDGSTSPKYQVRKPGLYSVIVANNCGTARDSVKVTFVNCQCNIILNSTITPNNDGNNDIFKVLYDCELIKYAMRIFDKSGKLLFESVDPNRGWDGRSNNKDLPAGIYFWQVDYQLTGDIGRNMQNLKGDIKLVR